MRIANQSSKFKVSSNFALAHAQYWIPELPLSGHEKVELVTDSQRIESYLGVQRCSVKKKARWVRALGGTFV